MVLRGQNLGRGHVRRVDVPVDAELHEGSEAGLRAEEEADAAATSAVLAAVGHQEARGARGRAPGAPSRHLLIEDVRVHVGGGLMRTRNTARLVRGAA